MSMQFRPPRPRHPGLVRAANLSPLRFSFGRGSRSIMHAHNATRTRHSTSMFARKLSPSSSLMMGRLPNPRPIPSSTCLTLLMVPDCVSSNMPCYYTATSVSVCRIMASRSRSDDQATTESVSVRSMTGAFDGFGTGARQSSIF
ncbi:hypothetical protein LX36DRAFT_209096 [Colletotrichum falcatum]|nr:hypothetical protein LX36DRAFT_209096 [Colletotrichum falcatum]